MGILEKIFRSTPRETDPAPPIKTTRPALPISDNDEPRIEGGVRYLLEPYFVMIEYRDSGHVLTQRRITMRSVTERQGTRYLNAICHERNALRTFRLDRIGCFISQDGEVEDAAAWFAETLAISETEPLEPQESRPRRASAASANISPYTAMRRTITPGLTFLIAAARSDDILHPRELDRILRYAEDEVFSMQRAGELPGAIEPEMFTKLERTIARLRPTREDIALAATELAGWNASRKRTLAHALAETAAADGQVDAIEAAIIEEMREIGTRYHGFGWDG